MEMALQHCEWGQKCQEIPGHTHKKAAPGIAPAVHGSCLLSLIADVDEMRSDNGDRQHQAHASRLANNDFRHLLWNNSPVAPAPVSVPIASSNSCFLSVPFVPTIPIPGSLRSGEHVPCQTLKSSAARTFPTSLTCSRFVTR